MEIKIHLSLFFLFLFVHRTWTVSAITNCNQLININSAKGSYVLQNDIDCAGHNFLSIGYYIGSGGQSFCGSIDGKGHKIGNLSLSYSGYCYVGFIEAGIGVTISNIVFENFQVSAGSEDYIGLVFGKATSCTVNNVILTSSQGKTNNIKGGGKKYKI